jgi:hypothetical protein
VTRRLAPELDAGDTAKLVIDEWKKAVEDLAVPATAFQQQLRDAVGRTLVGKGFWGHGLRAWSGCTARSYAARGGAATPASTNREPCFNRGFRELYGAASL